MQAKWEYSEITTMASYWNVQCSVCGGYIPIGIMKPEGAVPIPRHSIFTYPENTRVECAGGGSSSEIYVHNSELPSLVIKVEQIV